MYTSTYYTCETNWLSFQGHGPKVKVIHKSVNAVMAEAYFSFLTRAHFF